MTISMYKASAPIFVQFLTSLSAVLDKAASHAEAKKIDPAVLLDMRLSPDMYPLARQVRETTNHAARACGGAAGVELPSFANTESSIPELKERIARTIDFIKGLKPAQIDGTEDNASEACSIRRVAAAFVSRNLWIGADRTPPQRLIAVYRHLGGYQLVWRLTFFDPLFKRRQRINTGVCNARPAGLNAAMIHAWHHEEPCKFLRRRGPAGFPGERLIEIDRELRRDQRVGPTVIHDQLAATLSEGTHVTKGDFAGDRIKGRGIH